MSSVNERVAKPNVLVAVLGMSPAVVTETIYALAQSEERTFVHKVELIGTVPAADLYQRKLAGRRGALVRLARMYSLPVPQTRFHLLRNAEGTSALEDLRTTADSMAAWRQVFDIVRELVDSSALLLGSIAGGRKTLGQALTLAFQLLARRQDRLLHVLVPAPQEANPKFFFPRPGESVPIDLADVPFLRTRELAVADRVLDMEQLLAAVQARLDAAAQPKLEFCLDAAGKVTSVKVNEKLLWPNAMGIRLRQRDLHIWLHLARLRQRHDENANTSDPCPCCFRPAEDLAAFVPDSDRDLPHEFVRQAMSRIKRALLRFGLPLDHIDAVRFRGAGARPNRVYGLYMPPGGIRVLE